MARNENPPFGRGETFFQSTGATTSDPQGVIGKEWLFEDVSPASHQPRTNRYVRCRAVRNVSGISLLPRRLVSFKTAAQTDSTGGYGSAVDGYAYLPSSRGYPLDEYLPSTGLVNNDVGWIVVDGPAECLTDIGAPNDIAVGAKLIAFTASSSQATTAGRVDLTIYSGATTALANEILNFIGYALSAATSGSTNSPLLVEIGHW